ncbi:hypothetical protein FCM35_KLT18911 [Carex littledalei]|uniref:Copine C-terminal domain-containing protein n=1 Tax=Carex littledalei TaxID=544730 RepID=A0A833R0K2_9POAL|nr:hypothetical protein FCM35_KLT18911 [Carex littledalei]
MNYSLSKTLPSNPYSRIPDNYRSWEQVVEALQKANLESSNLIIGIDFTKSNEWTGPTSFAPIIDKAVDIVIRSGYLYHVLLIIADGQVTASDSENLSYQEECTKAAIQKASNLPLSIVLVGVGDGPWDLANNYDDYLCSRHFDNFQFVNFTEIMSMNMPDSAKEAQFALQALMEIPLQYAAIQGLGILGAPPRRSIPQISSGAGFESVAETFDHPVVYDANQEIRSMPLLAHIQGGLHRVQSNRFRRGSSRISRAVSSFSRLLGLHFRFLGTETDNLEETDDLER